jgi:hypothetical protein
MEIFAIVILSPLFALVLAIAVAVTGRSVQRSPLRWLVIRTVVYALLGAVASLVGVVVWMYWHERATGYSAGNAPVGWIFFYGPLSVASGQCAALIHWWVRKPTSVQNSTSKV